MDNSRITEYLIKDAFERSYPDTFRLLNTGRTEYSKEFGRYLPVFKVAPETYRWDGQIYELSLDKDLQVTKPIVIDDYYLLHAHCDVKMVTVSNTAFLQVSTRYLHQWVHMQTGERFEVITHGFHKTPMPTNNKTVGWVDTNWPNGTTLSTPNIVEGSNVNNWYDLLQLWMSRDLRLQCIDGKMSVTADPNNRLNVVEAVAMFEPLRRPDIHLEPIERVEYNDVTGVILLYPQTKENPFYIPYDLPPVFNHLPPDPYAIHSALETLYHLGYVVAKHPDEGWVLQTRVMELHDFSGKLVRSQNLNAHKNIQLPLRVPLIMPDNVEEVYCNIYNCQVKYKETPKL